MDGLSARFIWLPDLDPNQGRVNVLVDGLVTDLQAIFQCKPLCGLIWTHVLLNQLLHAIPILLRKSFRVGACLAPFIP